MSRLDQLVAGIVRRNPIKDPTNPAAIRSGIRAAETLGGDIKSRFGDNPSLRILDFGSAAGRVAVPMAKQFPRSTVIGCDVDTEAIEYFALTAPVNCVPILNRYNPPAPFPDQTFDCVYALSVWSHLPENLGMSWLLELQRITRPGGLLLISVAGAETMKVWQKQGGPWADIPIDKLSTEKFVYREFNGIEKATNDFPGIAGEGSWGNTAMHPDYVLNRWGKFFRIDDIRLGGMMGSQDLVVLTR